MKAWALKTAGPALMALWGLSYVGLFNLFDGELTRTLGAALVSGCGLALMFAFQAEHERASMAEKEAARWLEHAGYLEPQIPAAIERIEALEAERDALRAELARARSTIQSHENYGWEMYQEIQTLRTEIESYERHQIRIDLPGRPPDLLK